MGIRVKDYALPEVRLTGGPGTRGAVAAAGQSAAQWGAATDTYSSIHRVRISKRERANVVCVAWLFFIECNT